MPTRTTQLTRSARRLARALATCLAAGLAATAAHAEFIVTHPQPIPIDSNFPYFFTGPFNFSPEVQVTGGGVWSGTQYREGRVSNLPTGPNGAAEALSAMADSGWITTTQSGQAVGAYASIDLVPWSGSGDPTRARTTLFSNHVAADTDRKFQFTNSSAVTVQGTTHAAGSLYQRGSAEGTARSAWYDTWTAQQQQRVDLKLTLDGTVFASEGCPGCGTIYPPGTNAIYPAFPSIGFRAVLAVYDMDSVVPCGFDNIDWCGRPYAFPVQITEVNYRPNSVDQFPLVLDTVVLPSFETVVGHRYLAIGYVSVTSTNGPELDFYNTVSLRVNVPEGTLFSDGLGGADLGLHFAQPVPEPTTRVLLALGLIGLLLRTQRR